MKRKAVLFSSLILTVMMIVAFLGYRLGQGTGFTGNFEDQACYPGIPSTASYIVDTNNTHYICYEGFTGSVMSVTTDDQTLIQARINQLNLVGGGIIFLKRGTYSCSLTVKANVLLLMEPGVTGVVYTVDSGGYCMRYSGGYAYFEHPLNMTGNQLLFGAFHTGTSAPSGITTGQWWFDTSSYTLKVWNGTAWDAVTGATGAQGPPGKVEGLPFDYMVFENATASYLMNGNGVIDDSDSDSGNLINSAVGNLTDGGSIYLKSEVSTTTTVTINQRFISLISDLAFPSGTDEAGIEPYIQRIVLDASIQEIKGVRLEGLAIDELVFYAANGNEVRHNYIKNCRIKSRNSSNRRGIIIRNEESVDLQGDNYTDFAQFDTCYFYLLTQDPEYGFITLEEGGAAFGMLFDNCHMHIQPDDAIFLLKHVDAKGGFVFDRCSWATGGSGQSNQTWFWSNGGNWLEVQIADSSFEVHQQACILKSEATGVADNITAMIDIHSCRFVESSYMGSPSNLFLVNNSATMNSGSIFHLYDCRFDGIGQTYAGTLGGMPMELHDNTIDFVCENWGTASGTSPINNVNHGVNAGTPDYIILTPLAADAGDFYVAAITSTNFDIYFDGGGTVTFMWFAKYDP